MDVLWNVAAFFETSVLKEIPILLYLPNNSAVLIPKFPKTLSCTLFDKLSFFELLKLKPLWKHVFFSLDFYKYEAFIKRITHMFKSWFRNLIQNKRRWKRKKTEKDGKRVFQRIGRKYRPTQTPLNKIMTTEDNG